MRKPIAYDVLPPSGSRSRITPEQVDAIDRRALHVRQCDNGSIAVRAFWETRETFYSPVYRQRRAA